jgi:hypothetical protein
LCGLEGSVWDVSGAGGAVSVHWDDGIHLMHAHRVAVASERTAAAPPSPHIGMRGFPIRGRLFVQPFALGPHTFFRSAHQHGSPAMSIPYHPSGLSLLELKETRLVACRGEGLRAHSFQPINNGAAMKGQWRSLTTMTSIPTEEYWRCSEFPRDSRCSPGQPAEGSGYQERLRSTH